MGRKIGILWVFLALAAFGCDERPAGSSSNSEPPPQVEADEMVEEEAAAEPASAGAPSRHAIKGDRARSPRKRMMKKEGMPIGRSAPKPAMVQPEAIDTAADGETYEETEINPWTESAEDNLSTFAIDVDTGSYTNVRKKILEQKTKPPKGAVRVEEFVNYFRYDYPNPDKVFGVFVEGAPSPFATGGNRYLMRVGVQGKKLETKERKPIHLTLLVDVSGSMNNPDKLPLAVEALKILTNNMKEGDTIAIATYAGYVAKVLEPTGVENRGAIFEALDSLGAGGGTGMNSGMKLAYDMAMSQKKAGNVSRVIVLSDGDANIGPTSHEEILKSIENYVQEGVTLSTIGLGSGNYNEVTMEKLANKGNGNYYYIDSIKEARKVFGEQLDGTLQVIAKDVKIQVEFDKNKVPSYRLVGYENRDIADKDFRNDKVDAGEIGAGHTVTAIYELKLKGKPSGKLATVRVRHKKPDGFKASEQAFEVTDAQFHDKIQKASTDFQFAASVATFAEILRESPHVEGVNYEWVGEIASGAATPSQADRQEFIRMVAAAKSL